MTDSSHNDREERALDALVAAALHQGEHALVSEEEIRKFMETTKPLSSEGQAALGALGEDVVQRILAGSKAGDSGAPRVVEKETRIAVMHRKNTTGQNDPTTEAELERKRQELRARLAKKKNPPQ